MGSDLNVLFRVFLAVAVATALICHHKRHRASSGTSSSTNATSPPAADGSEGEEGVDGEGDKDGPGYAAGRMSPRRSGATPLLGEPPPLEDQDALASPLLGLGSA